MQIAQGSLFTRLATAAALSAIVGFASVAAHAQASNPTQVPNAMGTTSATTSGAATAGAKQQMQDDQMKAAEKKAKKAKKDAKPAQ